jgi:hypothetical protein
MFVSWLPQKKEGSKTQLLLHGKCGRAFDHILPPCNIDYIVFLMDYIAPKIACVFTGKPSFQQTKNMLLLDI